MDTAPEEEVAVRILADRVPKVNIGKQASSRLIELYHSNTMSAWRMGWPASLTSPVAVRRMKAIGGAAIQSNYVMITRLWQRSAASDRRNRSAHRTDFVGVSLGVFWTGCCE